MLSHDTGRSGWFASPSLRSRTKVSAKGFEVTLRPTRSARSRSTGIPLTPSATSGETRPSASHTIIRRARTRGLTARRVVRRVLESLDEGIDRRHARLDAPGSASVRAGGRSPDRRCNIRHSRWGRFHTRQPTTRRSAGRSFVPSCRMRWSLGLRTTRVHGVGETDRMPCRYRL